ncbi:LysE/ArgO family amino acid transporter [Candidatus Haliotispira prima]|uniref:LysE/ArgO family amino acid transporter n=1 Tax=Candidatus Haliotispira prima TaxID=3034016 RepID=A0ABY8MIV7_9SPIO|nr:LysE/ArgO family amino acid transporter [Candidatus Haliotispira prima]
MNEFMSEFISGVLLGLSLIVAIGAQNAFVIRQGVKKNYISYVISICILSDILLMSLGIFGVGNLIAINSSFLKIFTLLGIGFLLFYSFNCFRTAFSKKNNALTVTDDTDGHTVNDLAIKMPKKRVILLTLGVTYLNPHVYLDTLFLVGSIAANMNQQEKLVFLSGASFGSFLWFMLIGYGVRLILPIFQKPLTWKIFDITIGFLMIFIAVKLATDSSIWQ